MQLFPKQFTIMMGGAYKKNSSSINKVFGKSCNKKQVFGPALSENSKSYLYSLHRSAQEPFRFSPIMQVREFSKTVSSARIGI